MNMSENQTDAERLAWLIDAVVCDHEPIEGIQGCGHCEARTVLAWLATTEGRQAAARAMGAKYREDEGWGRLAGGADDPLLVMCPGERHTRWVIQSPWTEAQS